MDGGFSLNVRKPNTERVVFAVSHKQWMTSKYVPFTQHVQHVIYHSIYRMVYILIVF